jgi:hypothetical protein
VKINIIKKATIYTEKVVAELENPENLTLASL